MIEKTLITDVCIHISSNDTLSSYYVGILNLIFLNVFLVEIELKLFLLPPVLPSYPLQITSMFPYSQVNSLILFYYKCTYLYTYHLYSYIHMHSYV